MRQFPGNKYHYHQVSYCKKSTVKVKVRKIRPQQLEDFEALLINYDWSSVLNCTDTDKKVNNFLRVTENMISDYFQEKNGQNL